MYRLVKVRRVALNNNYANTFQCNFPRSNIVCSFCKFSHPKTMKALINYSQHRNQTTISGAQLNALVGKKVKRKRKTYAELLEVSENTTSNRKAAVKRINATQLSYFVNDPDLALDQLHKLKIELQNVRLQNSRNTHSFHPIDGITTDDNCRTPEVDSVTDATIVDSIHNDRTIKNDSGVCEKSCQPDLLNELEKDPLLESLEDECAVEEKIPQVPASLIKEKKRKNTKKEINKDMEAADVQSKIITRKDAVTRKALYSHMQVSLSCGLIAKVHQTLSYCVKSTKKTDFKKVLDIEHYNLLLRAYAKTANLTAMKSLLDTMTHNSIKPSRQTYAVFFEAFGRLRNRENELEFMNEIRDEMEKDGITFSDIIQKSKYIRNERKYTLRGVKFIEPDFKIAPQEPDYTYATHLMNNIDFTKTGVVSSPAENLFTPVDLKKRFDEQLKHEIDGELVVNSIAPIDEESPSTIFARKTVAQLEEFWTEKALEAFDRNLKCLKSNEQRGSKYLTLSPYLNLLDRTEYVKLIIRSIQHLVQGSETFSPTLINLQHQLGSQINKRYEILERQRTGVLKKTVEVYDKYCDWYLNRRDAINSRLAWQNIIQEKVQHGASIDAVKVHWPPSVCCDIGRFLFNIVLKDIKFDVNCLKANNKEKHYLPAFYVVFRPSADCLKEEIKPHPALWKLYREAQSKTLTFLTTMVPTVCPSKPWIDANSGAYLVSQVPFVRVYTPNVDATENLESVPSKQLWPIIDALNQLSSVPWSVNKSVLDVIIKVFRDGGSVKLKVPQPPSVLPPVPFLELNADEDTIARVNKERQELRRKKNQLYSLWCDCLYRLSLANHFRDKIFWLPHNMDFRGRCYPVPPHLNHLGSDLARCLLVFALRKPLGPKGFDWLKIHTINLTGFKKRDSVADRLKFANDNMDKILDSAKNPLTGQMWWAKSDEPWQTLAACMEIAKALESGDPENYETGFPIHQDGSCNGLQHYAALGRDQIGAESVNLCPFPTPKDVYSDVAAMVDNLRQKDEESGNPIAKVLKNYIRRKVIKQTVMTTVYGVTKFGARRQICRQLEAIEDFPSDHEWQGSLYLVEKTFESLSTMFKSARDIQDWLTACARIISSSGNKNVAWTTPLGLPVVQPYSKSNKVKMGPVFADVLKQKNAFAPNFVHSLDSTHMMLTSVHCENSGLTFMSVHDCYWTHACTVEEMNKICREQFVALHSEPILEDLSKGFIELFGTSESSKNVAKYLSDISNEKIHTILSAVPQKGTFQLEEVLKSTYFFS